VAAVPENGHRTAVNEHGRTVQGIDAERDSCGTKRAMASMMSLSTLVAASTVIAWFMVPFLSRWRRALTRILAQQP
jgi:hypothetical protein